MKKLIALIVMTAALLSASFVVASAGETKLTTTVPDASYTLNIPVNQEITFGAITTSIGNVTVTGASGFAVNKNLEVTLTWDDFKADGVTTTIPFTIQAKHKNANGFYDMVGDEINSGGKLTFYGKIDGTCDEYFHERNSSVNAEGFWVSIGSTDWGKALAGEYSSVITFTSEVVSASA